MDIPLTIVFGIVTNHTIILIHQNASVESFETNPQPIFRQRKKVRSIRKSYYTCNLQSKGGRVAKVLLIEIWKNMHDAQQQMSLSITEQ